ncbi:hypothetical protein DV737_g3626, partial [Chaetothyriales sp. CBS 132003]
MDRSLDEIVADRQRSVPAGQRRGGQPRRGNYTNYNYPRDGNSGANGGYDSDWVHDRYDDDEPADGRAGYNRSRPPPAKLRVDNLHYDLTEDEIYELFTRIAPVADIRMRYDRAGRSEGIAFVTYEHVADARQAIREFDGANAKGQPIRIQLLQLPRRDNPFDKVENPRSLLDRVEPPAGRSRRRSESPTEDLDDAHGYKRAPRRAPRSRERRSDVTKPAPENIDRYIPGEGGSRSSAQRGGRRPGERRERPAYDAATSLRTTQKPLKDEYRYTAQIHLQPWSHFTSTGKLDSTLPLSCSLSTGQATKKVAGLHRMAGGTAGAGINDDDGNNANSSFGLVCAGNMFL